MTNLQWHFPSFIIIISLFSIPIQHTHSLSLKAETTRRTWFQKSFLPSSAVAIFRSTSSSTFLVLGPVVPGVVGGVVRPQVSFAAETVGKDPDCNDASCLGVWDGLLADCPHYDKIAMYSGSAGCASSQDDTPGVFAEPWDYSDAPSYSLDYRDQMKLLLPAIQLVCSKRGDGVETLLQEGRYLRVLFTDGKTKEKSIGEFYFTPNDTTVQFRVGATISMNDDASSSSSRGSTIPTMLLSSSTKNLERCEMIRKELRYTKVPVLRNRKRALFFVESDFDSFGPGSAALGPPAEMSTGELEGRQDVDPRLKIDSVQKFPFGTTR